MTGSTGRSSRSSRAASAESGNSVVGETRTHTTDRQRRTDARRQKSASPADAPRKPPQLPEPARVESQRGLSAIRERPDSAAEAEVDGALIGALPTDGDGADSSPRDSGNHSLAGEEAGDLRESDSATAEYQETRPDETQQSREPENGEISGAQLDHGGQPEQTQPTELRDPEHGEINTEENPELEKPEGQVQDQQKKPEHQPTPKTSKPGSRTSSKQEHHNNSKPTSRSSSKQSQRAPSKEDHRTSSKQRHRASSKEDHQRKGSRSSSKHSEVVSLPEEQRPPSKQAEDKPSTQKPEDVPGSDEGLPQTEPATNTVTLTPTEAAEDQREPETEPESMSGDMEVLRAAEKMSLTGGTEPDMSRSMSLEHVIIEKYHEEPELEDNADPYQGPVEVPPLLTDLEEEPDDREPTTHKYVEHTEPGLPAPGSVSEQKQVETRNKHHVPRGVEKAHHPKPRENNTGKESRASSKAAQHGPSRSESRKTTANAKQSRKPSKIARPRPVARSHEDLRADLDEGDGGNKVATLRLPEDTGLQKSTSLVNIPRNPSALVSPRTAEG